MDALLDRLRASDVPSWEWRASLAPAEIAARTLRPAVGATADGSTGTRGCS